MTKRSAGRTQFLADLMTTAIEHAGYGFPEAFVWHCPEGKPAEWYASISNRYEDDGKTYRVDLDTMAHGLAVLKANGHGNPDLFLADRTNGDDGDYDVVDALAVLESALFGEVVYA